MQREGDYKSFISREREKRRNNWRKQKLMNKIRRRMGLYARRFEIYI